MANNVLSRLLNFFSPEEMNRVTLKIISPLYPVLNKMGVNTVQLNDILATKLLMDSRRPSTLFTNTNKSAAPASSAKVTVTTIILGALYGALLFLSTAPLIAQTLYFSLFMIMMILTLISDFTSVLIDVRDQYIIGPRPVNDRTMSMARILHVGIYVMRLALLQGLAGLIMVGYVDGIVAMPVFLIQLVLATGISILLVNIVYFLLIRAVSPQIFKDIISYFQIAFSVAIFVGYYILPRLIKISMIENFKLSSHTWVYFVPPTWIAGLNEALIHPGRAGLSGALLALTSLIVPVAGLWFVVKVLAPGFNQLLTTLSTSDGETSNTTQKATYQPGILDRVADLLAPDPVENAGFRITWKLAFRTREFKMKIFPAFAYVPVYFFFLFMKGDNGTLQEKMVKMQEGSNYIFLIYFSIMIISTILNQVWLSAKYKAAWVYYAAPLTEPGKILSGMFKALMTLYFFPYCLFLSVPILFLWGTQAISNLLLAFIIAQIVGLVIALFTVKGFPFSKPVLIKSSGGKILLTFFTITLGGILAYGQFKLSHWNTTIWVLLIPAVLIYWVMLKYYSRQTWKEIELSGEDY